MRDTTLLNSEADEMPKDEPHAANPENVAPINSFGSIPRGNVIKKDDAKVEEPPKEKNKHLISLFVAVLLIIFTLLPLANTRAEISGRSMSVSFNALDCLKIAGYSMSEMPTSRLQLTPEYRNLKRVGYPEAPRITNSSLAKDLVFLELRGGYSTLDLSSMVMAITIFALWLVCGLIIFNSLKCIFFANRDDEKHLAAVRDARMKLNTYALMLPLLLPFMGFVLLQGASIGIGKLSFLAVKSGIGIGFVLIAVAAVFLAFVFYGKRLLAIAGDFKTYRKKQPKQLLAFLMCVLLLVSVMLPVLSCEITSKSTRRSAKVSFDATDVFEMTYDDTSYYRSSSTGEGNLSLGNDLNNFLSSRRVAGRDKTLLYGIIMGEGNHYDTFTPTVFYLSNLVTLALLALICHRVIRMLVGDKNVKEIKKSAIWLAVIAAVQIILLIVFIVNGNSSLVSGTHSASFGIGIGPIIGFASVVALLLTFREKVVSEVKTVDRYYDNPDVSYAPYVVEYQKKKK
ncbi:MAG: hypothetical protein J6V80_01715 [Clostridia bacterium]|nr:hypothetical protein [Clostridia bacterium]